MSEKYEIKIVEGELHPETAIHSAHAILDTITQLLHDVPTDHPRSDDMQRAQSLALIGEHLLDRIIRQF